MPVPKEKWYQDGLRFTCTQCGNCCGGDPGYVWATREEIAKIAKYIGHSEPRLDKRYLKRVGLRYSLVEQPNGDCIFLRRADGKAACSIYPVRPLQCRTWPFWEELLRSPATWQQAAQRCPGMNHGAQHGFVKIEEVRLQRSW